MCLFFLIIFPTFCFTMPSISLSRTFFLCVCAINLFYIFNSRYTKFEVNPIYHHVVRYIGNQSWDVFIVVTHYVYLWKKIENKRMTNNSFTYRNSHLWYLNFIWKSERERKRLFNRHYYDSINYNRFNYINFKWNALYDITSYLQVYCTLLWISLKKCII